MTMLQHRLRKQLLQSATAVGLGGALLAFGAPALAQQAAPAPANSNTVGEVVVTAQFREQSLQKTPLAITAVNAQMLEARSQTNVFQVAAQAPNVTLKPAGAAFGSAMVAFIRGVGQTDFNFSQEPGVGIYVDDVYYATLTGSLLDLTDLDRVEVLRGPQGTLAGRNSIGGAIKLFSKKPNGEGGYLEGTYGSYNRIDFRGAMDFTVVPDKLYVRVSGAARHHEGYVTRLDYACSHPGSGLPTFHVGTGCELGKDGGQAYDAAKIAIRWIPNENVEVNLTADATDDQSPVQANTIVYARPNGVSLNGVAYDNKFVPYGPNAGDPNHPNDPFLSYATFIDPGQGVASEAGWKPVVVPPINTYKSWGVAGTIDWKLGPHLALKSISSYRHFFNSFAEDTPSSPIGVQLLLQTLRHRQVTQEFRLNGQLFDDKVDFTLGGFYADQNGSEEARVDLPYVGAGAVPGVPNFAFDFIHGPDTSPSQAKAAFGQVDWHVAGGLELVGGVRYSIDDKSYTYHRHNPDGTVPCGTPNFLPGGCTNWLVAGLNGQSASFHSTRVDWRVDLQYQITSDVMGYAQVSTGYKGGGIDARPFFGKGATAFNPATGVAAGCPDPDCQVKAFAPETLTAFELGMKTALFDHRLRLNAAAFYNKYNNIILLLSSCPNNSPGDTLAFRTGEPCALPVNAGNAHVKGVEFEAEAHPFAGLEMDGSVSYLDFKYVSLPSLDPTTGLSTTTGISINGVTPYTPKWKWNFGVQYELPFVEGGTLTPRFDISYQSDTFSTALNTPASIDPAKTVVVGGVRTDRITGYAVSNARITWRSMDRSWQAALEVTNLFDKLYYLTQFDLGEGGLPGYVAGQPAMPRQWAVTVKKTF